MKLEFLKSLGIADEHINLIMAEHGKSLNAEKNNLNNIIAQITAERDGYKDSLDDVQAKLKAFDGLDPEKTKQELVDLNDKLKKSDEKHLAELSKLKRLQDTKDFINKHQFVNEFTRDSLTQAIESALDDGANVGKSRQDLLDALIKDETGTVKPGIFADVKKHNVDIPAPNDNIPSKSPNEMTYTELTAYLEANPSAEI